MEHVSTSNQHSSSTYGIVSSAVNKTTQAAAPRYEPDYASCVICERTYSKNELYDMRGEYICENCLDGGDYASCERCGNIYPVDDMYDIGEYLCENCVEELSEEYYG